MLSGIPCFLKDHYLLYLLLLISKIGVIKCKSIQTFSKPQFISSCKNVHETRPEGCYIMFNYSHMKMFK